MKAAVVLAGLIILHVYLASKPIAAYAPTYDEPVHLTAGAVAWKMGNYRFNGLNHPILAEAWPAIPTIFLNPMVPVQHPAWLAQRWTPSEEYEFADRFLYRNHVNHEKLLNSGRWMQIFLSVILMVAASWMILRAYGPIAAFWFAMAWAFSPTILAHGTLISTDLAFAGLSFLCLLSYVTKQSPIIIGVLLGLCLASKFLTVALLPVLFLLWIVEKRGLKSGGIAALSALAVLLLIYRQNFGIFLAGVEHIAGLSQEGRSSFFLGEHRTTGWIAYFPFAFMAKSTLFELAGVMLALYFIVRRKISVPWGLWVPPAAFFLLATFSKVQIGHRHILVIYPLVFLLGGLAMQQLKKPWLVIVPLAAMMMVEAFIMAPHYLAYFNFAVGGPATGYRYLTDSNNDWGQGVKELSQELEPRDLENGIYFSYFGTADPHAYGIRYLEVGYDPITNRPDDTTNLANRPTKFAISVTNLQHTYFADKNIFAWLKERTPWKVVGHTIFVYDFKDAPDDIERLRKLRGGV